MPQQQIVPTWTAWNNANSTSPTFNSDPISGQYYASGGLNLGDYFDATNDEAQQGSYLANGLLFAGRYRYVQVDSGATAANVKTGTVGFMRSGSTVKTAVLTAAGTGGTAGTYVINATVGTGGGSGAQITITVGAAGAVTNVAVTQGGYGYVSPPTFNLNTATTGLSAATVSAQLGATVNVVTSADVALNGTTAQAGVGAVRPVVFLNSITPGNYGFIQELGLATVLSGNVTQSANQFAIVASGGSANGTMAQSSATYTPYAIGIVYDTFGSGPPAGTPFKIMLELAVVQD